VKLLLCNDLKISDFYSFLFILSFDLSIEITAILVVMTVVMGWVRTFRRNLLHPSSGFPTTRLHGVHRRPVIFITIFLFLFSSTRAALPERKPNLAAHTFQSLHQSGEQRSLCLILQKCSRGVIT